MNRARMLCVFVVAVLSSSMAFAQRPANPGNPGGGSPLAPQPLQVFDALDRQVGEVIEVNGRTSALVKYALPDGGYVVASVNRTTFSSGPANIGFIQPPRVYFKEADCSGDAYLLTSGGLPGSPFFLARRQALILDNLIFGAPEPPTIDPNCPIGFPAGRWLYASQLTACPLVVGPGSATPSITFQSHYGSIPGPNGFCTAATTTFPGPFTPGPPTFEVYERIEDISQKFRPPFYID